MPLLPESLSRCRGVVPSTPSSPQFCEPHRRRVGRSIPLTLATPRGLFERLLPSFWTAPRVVVPSFPQAVVSSRLAIAITANARDTAQSQRTLGVPRHHGYTPNEAADTSRAVVVGTARHVLFAAAATGGAGTGRGEAQVLLVAAETAGMRTGALRVYEAGVLGVGAGRIGRAFDVLYRVRERVREMCPLSLSLPPPLFFRRLPEGSVPVCAPLWTGLDWTHIMIHAYPTTSNPSAQNVLESRYKAGIVTDDELFSSKTPTELKSTLCTRNSPLALPGT
ncbi:hypothetical protein C8R45DRAFT_1224479 [Mycena sanguinolenta]|nr:hypothetical protein C8R45DRAFT_1224479 [Mycena sanguinolenta]